MTDPRSTGARPDHTARRAAMVAGLRESGITDPRVLSAMSTVPRERFVPAEVADDAYVDAPLPIGFGQTISTPWIVAFMSAALDLSPQSTVLEVGTGSGYGAAVLSRCCRSVVTVERHGDLADRAREVVRELGYDNIEIRVGDGTTSAADRGPFDAISVTAMAEDELPDALVGQLADGGTLLCPVGRGGSGDLLRLRGGRRERLAAVGFVPLVTGEHRRWGSWDAP